MKGIILFMALACIMAIVICDNTSATSTMNGGSTVVDTLNAVVKPSVSIIIKTGSPDPATLTVDFINNLAMGTTALTITSEASWNLKGSAPNMAIGTSHSHPLSAKLQAQQSGSTNYVDLDGTHDMYAAPQSVTTGQDFTVNYKQLLDTGSRYAGTYTTTVTWTVTATY
jgi:hypothetical protein